MANNNDGNSFYNMSTKDYINVIAENANMNNQENIRSDNYNNLYDMDYNNGHESADESEDYTSKLISNSKKKPCKQNRKKGIGRLVGRFATLTASALIFGGVAALMFNFINNKLDNKNKDSVAIVEETPRENNHTGTNDDTVDNTVTEGIIDTVSTDSGEATSALDVSDIAQNAMPSVVAITVKAVEEYNYGMFGGNYEYETEGSGSGIIIGQNDKELLIVTNNHVVSDANTVSVSFIDGSVYEAKVKGTDSENDLAVIVVSLNELTEDTKSQIKIAKLGNSDLLEVGEQVVAIGNALGYGQSVTTGIVSAVNRMNSTNATPLIQTDAAINPGNSGGALINMKGEVIGINSSKYMSTDVEGMGYAIPVSAIEDILDDLVNRETREKVDKDKIGYLGVGCATINDDAANMYGMPKGALVSEVKSGSPARKAGIKKNNIIVEFDGISISSAEQLVDLLEYYEAGETVTVKVAYLSGEEYKEKEIDIELGNRAS